MSNDTGIENRVWLNESDCSIEQFHRHLDRTTDPSDYPNAIEILHDVPVYDGVGLIASCEDDAGWRPVMAEWNRAFDSGPGVIAIRSGYTDLEMLDRVTNVLNEIISAEERTPSGSGDHFAAAGANSRLWNAHEKLCLTAPDLFVRYNTNELVRRASEAWLGPGYQITTQANVVRPGGAAQVTHRDYHMGFQTAETLRDYPASQHRMTARLTLQGAVAHSDMPIASGPTKLLPFSQDYAPGYLAVLLAAYRACFEERCVQIPLEKGDLLFFNPATFHAAGENRTADIHRFANLMQVGSVYGRSIEIVDRMRIAKRVYPLLREQIAANALSPRQIDNVVAATAEGYPFPANLDIESPLGGMAPPSQQALMRQALREGWSEFAFAQALDAQAAQKRSN